MRSLMVLVLTSFIVNSLVAGEVISTPLNRRAVEAANSAVRLIDRTSAAFLKKRNCFTCHTQTFAALVLTDAEKAGIAVNKKNLAAQVKRAYCRSCTSRVGHWEARSE